MTMMRMTASWVDCGRRQLKQQTNWPLLALIALTLLLGAWQWRRMQLSQQRLAWLQTQHNQALQPWAGEGAPPLDRPLLLQGDWLSGAALLLDHRIEAGRIGYLQIAPFRLQHGAIVLLEVGWTAQADRALPPLPPRPEVILAPWPRYFELAASAPRQRLFQNLIPQQFAAWSGLPLPTAFGRLRQRATTLAAPGLSPERHLGYALTWWGMSLCGLLLYRQYRRAARRETRP